MDFTDDDLLFRALADPTRRALLDSLFQLDGQTTGSLCEAFDVTRFAVMKHLSILEEANLVVVVSEGRTRLHFLNPVPITQIADRWISKFAEPTAKAMAELQTRIDSASHASARHSTGRATTRKRATS